MSNWISYLKRALAMRFRFHHNRIGRKRGESRYAVQGSEVLEIRQLLNGVGPTWDDASRLTLSFVPDGTVVENARSDLFQMLSPMGEAAVWQSTILDAFQAWAVTTNVNIGVVGDQGLALGTSGSLQGDSRFGDIRVAAAPLADDVLAISVPRSGEISGTWVGDIILNSHADFSRLADLYAVALHEAGHVLGLEHSSDPASPMYAHNFSGISRNPTADDIAQLQTLHGTRVADRNETKRANDTIKNATRMLGNEITDNYDGTIPLLAWGDITTPSDVDFFRLDPYLGYRGAIEIELRTSEISQLHGAVSVWNSAGKLVSRSSVASSNDSHASVVIMQTTDTNPYYIRVEAGTSTATSVGTYAVVVKYSDRLKTTDDVIQSVARGRFETLSKGDVQGLLRNGGRIDNLNDDHHADDTSSGALSLETTPGFAKFTHYRTIGSISDRTDVDYFRLQTPNWTAASPLVLHISVRSLEVERLLPNMKLYNSAGAIIPIEVISNGMGVYTIQARLLQPNSKYTLRISAITTGSDYSTGNYELFARFLPFSIQKNVFVQTSLDASQSSRLFQLDVTGTQLFQFGIDSDAIVGSPTMAIQLGVFDESGKLLYRLIGAQGDLRTGESVLLTPGTYFVQIAGFRFDKKPLTQSGLRIIGNVISDPIGPVIGDPTGAPPSPTKPGSAIGPKFTWKNTPTVAPPAKIGSPPNPLGALPANPNDLFVWYWFSGTLPQ